MDEDTSHLFNNPALYSLNTAIVAGSVQDADVACVACADGMRTREARVHGLMPDEVTGVVEIGRARRLDEEGIKLAEDCWMADVWMESVRCAVRAAWFIVDGVRI